MKRIAAVAVVLALSTIGATTLAQSQKPEQHPAVPYHWSSPLSSPAGQPLPSSWRSPMIAAPGETQPSRMDEDKIHRQMAADGAKSRPVLEPVITRIRNAIASK